MWDRGCKNAQKKKDQSGLICKVGLFSAYKHCILAGKSFSPVPWEDVTGLYDKFISLHCFLLYPHDLYSAAATESTSVCLLHLYCVLQTHEQCTGRNEENKKGPLHFHSFRNNTRPSAWAPLLSPCHQRSKFILPARITEEPTAKFQRATDPKWRPCSGILRTSSASSECCPVITGERKRRQNVTQSIFVISSYSCSFLFFPSPSKS